MVVDDPNARGGVFTHWIIYNIGPAISHLPAGIPAQESLPNGIRQGMNSFRKLGYAGPCPPLGETAHTYVISIYALSATPEIPSRATGEVLLAAIQPLILASTRVSGRFQRTLVQRTLKRTG